MSHSEACCTIPPVENMYEPIGAMETIDDLQVYVVGPEDAKKAVFVLYDIYGYHVNTKRFCDLLAEYGGYRVLMPDCFRGKPWTTEKMETLGMPAVIEFVKEVGTTDIIMPQLRSLRDYVKVQNINEAGLVGFCWGAKIAVQAPSQDDFFRAVAMIHPSLIDNKDAESAKAPVLAIPTKDEPDMTEYMAILSKKSFGDRCEHHRFDDIHHGFAATRADWSNENNRKRIIEAIQLTTNFFKVNLTA